MKESIAGGNAPTEGIHTNNSELTMASSMSATKRTRRKSFLLFSQQSYSANHVMHSNKIPRHLLSETLMRDILQVKQK